VSLIQGDTDADAQRILEHYQAGADVEAIANVYNLRVREKDATQSEGYRERFESARSRLFYGGVPFAAGPERIAAMVEELAVDGQVDGVMFVFPDFVDGLTRFGEQVMPLLRQRGVLGPAPASAPAANGHA
jgi:pyrimidine oxygenase